MSDRWFDAEIMRGMNVLVIQKMRLSRDVVISEMKKKAKRFRKTANLETSFGSRFISRLRMRIFNSAEYASDVEFGTAPHEIKPKKKKALAFQMAAASVIATGQSLFRNRKTGKLNKRASKNTMTIVKSVQHPGTKAQPFMRPGYRAALPKLRRLWGK